MELPLTRCISPSSQAPSRPSRPRAARAAPPRGGDTERRWAAAVLAACFQPTTSRTRRHRTRVRRFRAVGAVDEVETKIRARRRPPAAVMSKRTTLTGAPSLLSLEQCLAEHRFEPWSGRDPEEADQITRDLLLIFGGPEPLQRGYLKPEEVAQISEEELRRVDELWSLHSAGRFGYAAQRRRLEEAGHDFSEFMQRVGWLRSEQGHEEQLLRFWPRRDFEYSLEAPEGHLPLTNLIRGRDLLVSLLQHPAFSSNGARQGVAPPPPRKSVNEANEEEVRSWWAKLIGAADEEEEETPHEDTSTAAERQATRRYARITMITGFESFNARLYRNAAREAILPGLSVCVFTDQDIVERREVVQQVLREMLGKALGDSSPKGMENLTMSTFVLGLWRASNVTDVFFCSLIFDFDQAEWLREQCQDIKVRMIFESAVELMSCTQALCGSFVTEDRIAGYTKFLKAGPKLLQMLPQFGPIVDLRRWLQTYAFWSGGGAGNVAKMLRYVAREFGGFAEGFAGLEDAEDGDVEVPAVVEIPQVGLLHPSLKYAFQPGPFFETPKKYLEWYRSYRPEAFAEQWPVVAVLLYRKHVVSELSYIWQLVNYLEDRRQSGTTFNPFIPKCPLCIKE
eukprot:g23934.t1